MRIEAKESIERDRARFEDLVFANNPKLHEHLFGTPAVPDDQIENEEFDWIIPKNEEEVQALMDELQASMAEVP